MPSLRDPDSRTSLVTRALVMPVAVVESLIQIAKFRPDVCCTTGGVLSPPVRLPPPLARVPALLWERAAGPGRLVPLLARTLHAPGANFEPGQPRPATR